MKNQQFKHNPISVEAILFTGENHREVGNFLLWPEPRADAIALPGSGIEVDARLRIFAVPNEYVLRDVNGNLAVMPANQFADKYRPVDPTEAVPGVLLEDYIANPSVIWYGPHPCSACGETIIRAELEQGGVKLDAPHEHHYPNHQWALHDCRGYGKSSADAEHMGEEGSRDGEALMEVQRKCPFPPIPTSTTPPAVAAGPHDPAVLSVPNAESDDIPFAPERPDPDGIGAAAREERPELYATPHNPLRTCQDCGEIILASDIADGQASNDECARCLKDAVVDEMP